MPIRAFEHISNICYVARVTQILSKRSLLASLSVLATGSHSSVHAVSRSLSAPETVVLAMAMMTPLLKPASATTARTLPASFLCSLLLAPCELFHLT